MRKVAEGVQNGELEVLLDATSGTKLLNIRVLNWSTGNEPPPHIISMKESSEKGIFTIELAHLVELDITIKALDTQLRIKSKSSPIVFRVGQQINNSVCQITFYLGSKEYKNTKTEKKLREDLDNLVTQGIPEIKEIKPEREFRITN
jgi:hypothetical protein